MVRLASLVDGFEIPIERNSICASCVAGKLTRRPFPRSLNERASKPLWLLHIDFLINNVAGNDGETLAMVIRMTIQACVALSHWLIVVGNL